MEEVKQLQVELNEAKQKRERLRKELLSLSYCIKVFQNELKIRKI